MTAELLVYRSRERVDDLRTRRASHQTECDICGLTYLRHKLATEPWLLGWPDGVPFLHRLCDGSLVKL